MSDILWASFDVLIHPARMSATPRRVADQRQRHFDPNAEFVVRHWGLGRKNSMVEERKLRLQTWSLRQCGKNLPNWLVKYKEAKCFTIKRAADLSCAYCAFIHNLSIRTTASSQPLNPKSGSIVCRNAGCCQLHVNMCGWMFPKASSPDGRGPGGNLKKESPSLAQTFFFAH